MLPNYLRCDRKIAANTGCEGCRTLQCSAEAPVGSLLPSGGESPTKQILPPEGNQNALPQCYISPPLNTSRGKANMA